MVMPRIGEVASGRSRRKVLGIHRQLRGQNDFAVGPIEVLRGRFIATACPR